MLANLYFTVLIGNVSWLTNVFIISFNGWSESISPKVFRALLYEKLELMTENEIDIHCNLIADNKGLFLILKCFARHNDYVMFKGTF